MFAVVNWRQTSAGRKRARNTSNRCSSCCWLARRDDRARDRLTHGSGNGGGGSIATTLALECSIGARATLFLSLAFSLRSRCAQAHTHTHTHTKTGGCCCSTGAVAASLRDCEIDFQAARLIALAGSLRWRALLPARVQNPTRRTPGQVLVSCSSRCRFKLTGRFECQVFVCASLCTSTTFSLECKFVQLPSDWSLGISRSLDHSLSLSPPPPTDSFGIFIIAQQREPNLEC